MPPQSTLVRRDRRSQVIAMVGASGARTQPRAGAGRLGTSKKARAGRSLQTRASAEMRGGRPSRATPPSPLPGSISGAPAFVGISPKLLRAGTNRRRRRGLFRQIDREDASLAGKIADAKLALHRLDGLQTDREPKPQATPVRTSLVERLQEALCFAGWQAAAPVLDLDEDTCRGGGRPEGDRGAGERELERVLEQVEDGGGEDLSIGSHDDHVIDRLDREMDSPLLGQHRGADLHLLDEFPDRDAGDVLDARV